MADVLGVRSRVPLYGTLGRGTRGILLPVTTSVLELMVGGLPFPHGGPNGEWRYRHAVRPEGPSPSDHQAVADFLTYETAHGRSVTVVADDALSDWETWRPPVDRPSPGAFASQCCSHAYAAGCGSELVCHGASAAVASQVLKKGVLLAATAVTGREGVDLAAVSTWGEPPDYFDYVMLANGKCTAPEAVAVSRSRGRDLVPSDLRPGYPPAVRFYFRWNTLTARQDAEFDGVHPVKMKRRLPLDEILVAVVVHASHRDVVERSSPARFLDRLIVLDVDNPVPDQWATAALTAAENLA